MTPQPANAQKVTLIGNDALKRLPNLNEESLMVLRFENCDLQKALDLPNYKNLQFVVLRNCTHTRHFVWALLDKLRKLVLIDSTPATLNLFSSDEWGVIEKDNKRYYLKK